MLKPSVDPWLERLKWSDLRCEVAFSVSLLSFPSFLPSSSFLFFNPLPAQHPCTLLIMSSADFVRGPLSWHPFFSCLACAWRSFSFFHSFFHFFFQFHLGLSSRSPSWTALWRMMTRSCTISFRRRSTGSFPVLSLSPPRYDPKFQSIYKRGVISPYYEIRNPGTQTLSLWMRIHVESRKWGRILDKWDSLG